MTFFFSIAYRARLSSSAQPQAAGTKRHLAVTSYSVESHLPSKMLSSAEVTSLSGIQLHTLAKKAIPWLVLTPLNVWLMASGVEVTSSVWLSPVMNPLLWNMPLQRLPIAYLETLHSTTAQMATAWRTILSSSVMLRASGFLQKVRLYHVV